MINIYQARDMAFKLASERYIPGTTNYTSFSPIYIAATSNVTSMVQLYQNYNSVLSVGGTGAISYEVALNGAKNVDLFDVNFLQKLYFEYMKTAITYLDYKTFIKHFTLPIQKIGFTRMDLQNLLSNELYDKLVDYLPTDVETVFTPLYDYFDSLDLILSGLFRFEHTLAVDYLKKNISFYNEEQYYKLQKILRSESCKFNYETISLENTPKYFQAKYDLIFLDNILQYYKDIPGMDTPYLVNMFIQKKLNSLLKDEGKIQVNYGFEVATDALKEKLKIPYNNCCLEMYGVFQLIEEMKSGINIPLIEKWDNYTYSFVPGVERILGRDSENLVLTYRKRTKK